MRETAAGGGSRRPWWWLSAGVVTALVLGVLLALVLDGGGDDGAVEVEVVREGVAALTAAGSADLDPVPPAEATELPGGRPPEEEATTLDLGDEAVDELLATTSARTTRPGDDLGFEQVGIDRRLVGRDGATLGLLASASPDACLAASPDAGQVDLSAAEDAAAVCVATTEGNRALLIEIARTSRVRDGISEQLVLVAFQTFPAR